MNYRGIDIGEWEYNGPRDYAIKLIDVFGEPLYVEKNPANGSAGSITFGNIDGFDTVRVVDANTNKFHPYPAKVFVEASLFVTVPRELIGALKLASPTILIDELTQKVTGRSASLTISAVTLNFVIDCINGTATASRQEYDRRVKRVIDDEVLDPEFSWWSDTLREMKSNRSLEINDRNECEVELKLD